MSDNKKTGSALAALCALFLCLSAVPLPGQEVGGLMLIRPGRSKAISSTDPSFTGNGDRIRYIKPGETKVLADIKGPAVIRHIWLTFNDARPNWLEAAGSAACDEIVIRMYWDGAAEPAVEAPISDFFGAGFGRRLELKSVPVQVEGGDGYNCYWPMPFYKHGVITVTNESSKNVRSFYYQVDYTEEQTLPTDTGYFCAQYNQAFPEKLGSDYTVLEASGRGQYVGTVMSVRSRSPFWFGEGDARFYIDGESKPSVQGTGTEDYFLMAWGLNEAQFPYFGCTLMSSDFEDLGTQYCLYRWHIADPIRFTKSLRFDMEHTGWMTGDETESGKTEGHVEREDDIATVAFWYQVGQPRRFAKFPPPADRRLPNLDVVIEGKAMLPTAKYSDGILEIQKGYDWTGDGQILFKPVTDHPVLDVEFNVEKEEYRGLILRMTHAEDFGIYRLQLDGKDISQPEDYMAGTKIQEYNFYSPELKVKDHYLGSMKLSVGKHTLRFECIGRDPHSKGNYLGVDSVRLRERWNRKRKLLT